MQKMTRRTSVKQLCAVAAVNALPALFFPRVALAAEATATPPTREETVALAQIARQFLDRFQAPGLSVAIARHGQMVYQEGFGLADSTSREPLTPSHLFRIASISKPVTSVCVFSLIEQGRLRLDDPVFGERGLLKSDYGQVDPALNEISLHHLLTHTAGGWEKGPGDPMFQDRSLGQKALIELTLRSHSLKYPPGTHFGYSNFGYCLLGRVLEKVSGQSYPEIVRQNVLNKCGIASMQIGGNTLAQRARGEVAYHGQNGENPYNMNVTRMDSHGGWIATPGDLVQFALRADGFDTPPDILRPETIQTMVTPSTADSGYACGWAVNKVHNWWHNGSLPGVSTIMVRTSSGLCWAAFTNTRAKDIDLALDKMVWEMVKAVPAWRA
jgi:CubicO group peptidase (beta-lactamase class C family)